MYLLKIGFSRITNCGSPVTAKRQVVQKLPEKGNTVRTSAITSNIHKLSRKHMPLPVAVSPESACYLSVIEICVILGPSTAETVSHTKRRFGMGTPLALALLDGKLN